AQGPSGEASMTSLPSATVSACPLSETCAKASAWPPAETSARTNGSTDACRRTSQTTLSPQNSPPSVRSRSAIPLVAGPGAVIRREREAWAAPVTVAPRQALRRLTVHTQPILSRNVACSGGERAPGRRAEGPDRGRRVVDHGCGRHGFALRGL